MKYEKEDINKEKPIFSNKEKMLIMYFLNNDNKPTYPTKISKELKNKISRVWALEKCKELKQIGIMNFKKYKPPRQKNKTEWYYLRDDFKTFVLIAYNFLFSYNYSEQLRFIQTKFVQEKLNENFIRNIFYYNGIYIKAKYPYDDLSKSDKDRYYNSFKQEMEKDGNEYFISFKSVDIDEIKKLKKENPDIHTIIKTGHFLSVKFPIFPKDLPEPEKKTTFSKVNTLYPEFYNLYNYFFVRKYYDYESNELNELFEKYLILIQISPNALKDLLFFDLIYPQHNNSSIDNVLDRLGHIITGGIDTKILPHLIIDVIFDLAKSDKLPQYSMVNQARINMNPDTKKLTEPLLKLILKNGKEYSFPMGFVLEKTGIKTFHFDTGKVSK